MNFVSKKLVEIEKRADRATVAELRVESAEVQQVIAAAWDVLEHASALQGKIARLMEEQLASTAVDSRILVRPSQWVVLPSENPAAPAQATAA